MSSGMPEAIDEFRHVPVPVDSWSESWAFDVVALDANWALHAQLGLHPNRRSAWWWALLARRDQPLLLVRDDALALPTRGSLELRGDALWADVHCHEPMERWQVNFEGIALALDEPSEVGHGEVGIRVPIEFEFEWEATAPALARRGGYDQACMVDGEVQIGAGGAGLALEQPVPGRRGHAWGEPAP